MQQKKNKTASQRLKNVHHLAKSGATSAVIVVEPFGESDRAREASKSALLKGFVT